MSKTELMEEVLRLGIEVAKWKKLAEYGLFLYTQTRMVYGDDPIDAANRIAELTKATAD